MSGHKQERNLSSSDEEEYTYTFSSPEYPPNKSVTERHLRNLQYGRRATSPQLPLPISPPSSSSCSEFQASPELVEKFSSPDLSPDSLFFLDSPEKGLTFSSEEDSRNSCFEELSTFLQPTEIELQSIIPEEISPPETVAQMSSLDPSQQAENSRNVDLNNSVIIISSDEETTDPGDVLEIVMDHLYSPTPPLFYNLHSTTSEPNIIVIDHDEVEPIYISSDEESSRE